MTRRDQARHEPAGKLLLIVEINHPPTQTEPITLRREMLEDLRPEFATNRSWKCALFQGEHNVYRSVVADRRPAHAADLAVFCAALTRAGA